jgi:predicted permease
VIQDLRYCVRQMVNSPGFTLTAVISLALGIGATTAVFSVIYAALINPYPYPAADRIVRLTMKSKAADVDWINLNGLQVRQLQQSPVVESVLAMDYHAMTLTGRDYPENVRAVSLIANGFHDLGVPPLLGRGLLPSDAIEGQEPQPVTVLSYKFWQTHYFSNPDVIGKKIELDRKSYVIVGVAAPRFTWYNSDVWLPLKLTQDPPRTFVIDFFLKPGVTHAAADAALQPLVEQFARDMPKHFPEHFKVRVEGLNEWVTRSMSGTLYLLLGAVVLLLAIGCGNVSILLLARGSARQHELAVRSAVGANRSRLVQQLLTESFVLSVLGAALGVLLSYGVLAGIRVLLPRYAFAPEVVIRVNRPVLFFSIGMAVVTGVLFGLWPAIQLSRTKIGQAMQRSARRVAGSVQGRRTHQALVSGQIALTLLLLTGAGAAMEGFLQLIRTPLGYDPHNVMSVPIPLRDNSYITWAVRATYFDQLQKTVSDVPGVTMTAISSNATPPRNGWDGRFELMGKTANEQPSASINFVSPSYFTTLHIPLLEGRLWNETENRNGAHVAVINRALAQHYFPNGHAIGHALKLPGTEDRPPVVLSAPQIADSWLTVVGIVADARNDGLRNPVKSGIYLPYTLSMAQYTQVLVRSEVPPLSLVHAIRTTLAKFNPDQQTYEQGDLESWISDDPQWQQEHLAAWIFGVFATLALALAAVGLYSVVSYAVTQRTGEFGIRMALGAQRADVLSSVFAANLASVGGGIIAGLVLALALSGIVEKWAGGNARDPIMLVAGMILLSVVSVIACAIPARRATAIDPMSALRFD